MRQKSIPVIWTFAAVIVVSLCVTREASAQLEMKADLGVWAPFLPSYKAGSIVNGGTPVQRNIFRDNQADVGMQAGIHSFYRLSDDLPLIESETMFAGINQMGSSQSTTAPAGDSVWLASLNGVTSLSSGAGGSADFGVDSEVFHWNKYLGLRENFALGGSGQNPISLGAGLSMMQFQQNHQLDALFSTGTSGQYLEDVDTDYIGGEIRATISRSLHGHCVKLDLAFGVYDMNADYEGTSVFRNAGGVVTDTGSVTTNLNEVATTFDVGLRMDSTIRGVLVQPSINFKYISDMVAIDHPQTENAVFNNPVSIRTDDAIVLSAELSILL